MLATHLVLLLALVPVTDSAAQTAPEIIERWEKGLEPAHTGKSREGQRAALRKLVRRVEAGPLGYDAVMYLAKVQPPGKPTELTINEILAWIEATPGQQHGIGAYQIIPPTLRSLIQRSGAPGDVRFTPQLQDRFADILLADAGLEAHLAGRIGRRRFLDGLARMWAAFPVMISRTAYQGVAKNRSAMTRPVFAQEVDRALNAR